MTVRLAYHTNVFLSTLLFPIDLTLYHKSANTLLHYTEVTHLFLIHKLLVCLPSSVLAETAVAGTFLAIWGDSKWLLIKTRSYLLTHMHLNSENLKKAFKALKNGGYLLQGTCYRKLIHLLFQYKRKGILNTICNLIY